MNRLSTERRLEILLWLCRGASLRGVTRSAGVSVNTVTKLLIDAGSLFARIFDERVRNVSARRLICYKGWCPVVVPGTGLRYPSQDTAGVWIWVALECDSNLIVSYKVGERDAETARAFMHDLSGRLATPLPTPGEDLLDLMSADSRPFEIGVCDTDRGRITPMTDAQLAIVEAIDGRVFTRKGVAYSRKPENLGHMAVIYYVWSNFARRPKDGVTPAMAAGVAERPYTLAELAAPLTQPPPKAGRARARAAPRGVARPAVQSPTRLAV